MFPFLRNSCIDLMSEDRYGYATRNSPRRWFPLRWLATCSSREGYQKYEGRYLSCSRILSLKHCVCFVGLVTLSEVNSAARNVLGVR